MKARQSAFLKMCAAVSTAGQHHAGAWSGNEYFEALWQEFMQLYSTDSIQALARQLTTSKGVTEGKKKLRKGVNDQTNRLGRALVLIALMTNDNDLRCDAWLSPSSIKDLTEKGVVGHAEKLISLAAGHEAALEDQQIDGDWLAAYAMALKAFTTAVGTPAHAIAEGKRGTQMLATTIAALREVLEKLDVVMAVLQYTQPAFYSEWKGCRKIIDPPTRTRALTVTICDAETRKPLAGAIATIDPGNTRKKSGAQGRFYVQSLKPGTYRIKVEQAGYQPATLSFAINKSEGVYLSVMLEAAL